MDKYPDDNPDDNDEDEKEVEEEDEEEVDDIKGFAFELSQVIAATAGGFVEGLATPSANRYAFVATLAAGIRNVVVNEANHFGLAIMKTTTKTKTKKCLLRRFPRQQKGKGRVKGFIGHGERVTTKFTLHCTT